MDFGFWILENCPIPHFKVDRTLQVKLLWESLDHQASKLAVDIANILIIL